MRPYIADIMRAVDDLEEARQLMLDTDAPTPEAMEAERLLIRSTAILHAHVKALLTEPV